MIAGLQVGYAVVRIRWPGRNARALFLLKH